MSSICVRIEWTGVEYPIVELIINVECFGVELISLECVCAECASNVSVWDVKRMRQCGTCCYATCPHVECYFVRKCRNGMFRLRHLSPLIGM
jgi:hypothetical protein